MALSKSLQKQLDDKVEYYLQIADGLEGFERPNLTVRTHLRGTTGGEFVFRLNRVGGLIISYEKDVQLRFHSMFLKENTEHYLKNTVGHEIAHLVAFMIHTYRGHRVKPHGIEWRAVMAAFGLKPETAHVYSTKNLTTRKAARVAYGCGCSPTEHHITAAKHNKVQSGMTSLSCRVCKQPLHAADSAPAVKTSSPFAVTPSRRDKLNADIAAILAPSRVNKAPKPKAPVKAAKKGKFETALKLYALAMDANLDRDETIEFISRQMDTNRKNAATYYSRCKRTA